MLFFIVLAIGVVMLVGGVFWFFLDDSFGPAWVAIVGAILVMGSLATAGAFYNPRTIECTIADKDRGTNRDGGSNYRIYTEECGTFANEDSFFRGKFDSGDLQGSLEVGQTYTLDVVGPRFGPLSLFPNVLDAEPVVG